MSTALKILVPVKRVIDYAVRCLFSPSHSCLTLPPTAPHSSQARPPLTTFPTDQTPRQQIPHRHRNRRRQTFPQPL